MYALTGAFLLLSCEPSHDTPAPTPGAIGAELRAPSVEISKILSDPASFRGETVRIAGQVSRVLSDRAFVVASQPLFAAPRELVVVAPQPIQFAGIALLARQEVIVTGRIPGPGAAPVESALGHPLAAGVADAIADRPALVARTIRRTGAESGWQDLALDAPTADAMTDHAEAR
ncbi:MAG: hypothetical protein ABI467_01755 [Kofleriaceae bacterium]